MLVGRAIEVLSGPGYISRVDYSHNSNLINHSGPYSGQKEKLNLNFYFYTFLWCLKRFYEGLHQTFWGNTQKCEKKFKLVFILVQHSEMHVAGRVNLGNWWEVSFLLKRKHSFF